ncbi:hypothetical protein BDV98DRAFT_578406 [Pterulicium gracile]|uniref:Uncharacterized protein n=1 Tax=Pterulicium gracile TaxID=1884261 RepID=A0A5C3PZK5_9AGAR|nr:hypothetical protein BDV98DRAFT_578406 [Pterula gracilis]
MKVSHNRPSVTLFHRDHHFIGFVDDCRALYTTGVVLFVPSSFVPSFLMVTEEWLESVDLPQSCLCF